jgi:hypothetical protein
MSQVGTFESQGCYGNITFDGKYFKIAGSCPSSVAALEYIASSPPDSNGSYMGSGLPFPNEEYAHSNTVNAGSLQTNGSFEFLVLRPNVYYDDSGKHLINANVKVTLRKYDGSSVSFRIDLGLSSVPDRSLTDIPGRYIRSTGR